MTQPMIPAPTTAKDVLRILRDFMQRGNLELDQMLLWEVLTSLRGPDIDALRHTMKDATTSVIRAAVFGNSVAKVGATSNEDDEDSLQLRQDLANLTRADDAQRNYHFVSHARRAFAAVGLEWDKVNNVDRKKGIL